MFENHFCAFETCPFLFLLDFWESFLSLQWQQLAEAKVGRWWPGGPAPLALDAGTVSPLRRESLSLPRSVFLAAARRDGEDTTVAPTTPPIFWLSSLVRSPFPATHGSRRMLRWGGNLFPFPTKKRSYKQHNLAGARLPALA